MQRPEVIRHPRLDERTVQFGMLCIWVCEQLPPGYAGRNLADFVHKLKVALKEHKESRAWQRFARELIRDPFVDDVIRESHEIRRMMGATLRTRGCGGWAARMNTEN